MLASLVPLSDGGDGSSRSTQVAVVIAVFVAAGVSGSAAIRSIYSSSVSRARPAHQCVPAETVGSTILLLASVLFPQKWYSLVHNTLCAHCTKGLYYYKL